MASMINQYCTSCRKTTWHNPTSTKYSKPRCTNCGDPVTSNPGKREAAEAYRRKKSGYLT